MANKSLFNTRGWTDATNGAGATAYAQSPQATLAQYAVTGCLNDTFYATAKDQLQTVIGLCATLDAEFIAQTAVYARAKGGMKDLPAMLCAILAGRKNNDAMLCLDLVFDRVIDNGKMLRNFVQMVRSGAVGRKSLGSGPRRLVRRWFAMRTDEQVFRASVGNFPSLADIVKMCHPRPATDSRRALYGYLLHRDYVTADLPPLVASFEAWKWSSKYGWVGPTPKVPFQMLTGERLHNDVWMGIAMDAGWQATRMNLNTFKRHGVFKDPDLVALVADRLRDPALIAQARVFPYQLLAAWQAATEMPPEITHALQQAMEISCKAVPRIDGRVVICPDVSGSMQMSVTGYRPGATSKVRCIDVAGLVASAFLRANRTARVLPFEHKVVNITLNAWDAIVTNASKLAAIGGGGTQCAAPLKQLVREGAKVDLVILVSDNESWGHTSHAGTPTMIAWNKLRKRNPNAKLVCLDVVPNRSTQARSRSDILNIGGFSDNVFKVIAAFAKDEHRGEHLVQEIARI